MLWIVWHTNAIRWRFSCHAHSGTGAAPRMIAVSTSTSAGSLCIWRQKLFDVTSRDLFLCNFSLFSAERLKKENLFLSKQNQTWTLCLSICENEFYQRTGSYEKSSKIVLLAAVAASDCACTHRKILSTLGENSCRLHKCGRPTCASYGRSALKMVKSNTKKLNDCCDCPLNDEKRVRDASCWDIVSIKQINTLTSIVLFQRWRFSLGYLGLYQVKWQEESENQPIYTYFSSLPGPTRSS